MLASGEVRNDFEQLLSAQWLQFLLYIAYVIIFNVDWNIPTSFKNVTYGG